MFELLPRVLLTVFPKSRNLPGSTVVDRDLYLADACLAGPGEARDTNGSRFHRRALERSVDHRFHQQTRQRCHILRVDGSSRRNVLARIPVCSLDEEPVMLLLDWLNMSQPLDR